jgi:hypothetical protein
MINSVRAISPKRPGFASHCVAAMGRSRLGYGLYTQGRRLVLQESLKTRIFTTVGVICGKPRFEDNVSWPAKARFSLRAEVSAESPLCWRSASAASSPSSSSRPPPSVRWAPVFRSAATQRGSCGRSASVMRCHASPILRRDVTIALGTMVIVSTTRRSASARKHVLERRITPRTGPTCLMFYLAALKQEVSISVPVSSASIRMTKA